MPWFSPPRKKGGENTTANNELALAA